MHYPLTQHLDDIPEKHIPFIDYGYRGVWIFGYMIPHDNHNIELMSVLEEDVCIETLIDKALNKWHIEPSELWMSELGCQLTIWYRDGMSV